MELNWSQKISLELGDIKIDNILERTVAIVAGKGGGKSQTLKMLAVKAAEKDIPVYLFDPLGIQRIDGFQTVIITSALVHTAEEGKTDDELIKKFAEIFNKIKDKKIIFSYRNMLQSEIVLFTNSFFKYWNRKECIILLDEAHDFVPERGLGQEYSEEIERAVRHERNKKVGYIITTQRPAFTSKKVLGLIDFMILYRITYTNDVEAVKDLIKNMLSKEETDNVIRSVQTKGFLEGFTIDFMPGEKEKIEYHNKK